MNGNVLLFILTGVVVIAAFGYTQYSTNHEDANGEKESQ